MLIDGDTAGRSTISAVTTAAFRPTPGAPEPSETVLVRRLRADEGWLPALSMVAVIGGVVIGHVVCTRGAVSATPALGLGPMSVLPDRQGLGVGHALMHAVLGAADATGEALVALLGEPEFFIGALASLRPRSLGSTRPTPPGVTTSKRAR